MDYYIALGEERGAAGGGGGGVLGSVIKAAAGLLGVSLGALGLLTTPSRSDRFLAPHPRLRCPPLRNEDSAWQGLNLKANGHLSIQELDLLLGKSCSQTLARSVGFSGLFFADRDGDGFISRQEFRALSQLLSGGKQKEQAGSTQSKPHTTKRDTNPTTLASNPLFSTTGFQHQRPTSATASNLTALQTARGYRGRIAPTPTGYLHMGHASTFLLAQQRAREQGGVVIFRNEDLDQHRCRQEYVDAMYTDLRWLGLDWSEGPDVGGPFGPYSSSLRMPFYLDAWSTLARAGMIYPCNKTRKDVALSVGAPHLEDSEPLFPTEWRPPLGFGRDATTPDNTTWRFRVPDGETIVFTDSRAGRCEFVAGQDFGDFVVWRRDGGPAYELAVVVDDAHMMISEVVRGEDLLLSTARQLLLYRAFGWAPPEWHHSQLLCDNCGVRLAKRNDALSLRHLRESGMKVDDVLRKITEARGQFP
eukprot:gb/GEZN01006579.1/.p1 GENE.gb/GEZN01006579.1/~~gb/GEZN01006579.1/.p1  ORF type:complete len:532 (-),score=44.78 gb/GEZN01006579.1/:48-1469(-)